jgi:putative Holliday junction resolvase
MPNFNHEPHKTSKVVLGFDFGMQYIGVAVGQSITHSASPLTTLRAKDGIPNWNEVQQLLTKWHPQALVVGLPLNMDDTEQPLTLCARRFMNRLHSRFKLPVYAVDERLSSWEAKQRITLKATKQTKQHTNKIHAQSAVILIEQWWNEQQAKVPR